MVIDSSQEIAARDSAREAWLHLKRFQNIEECTDILIRLHNLPSKQRANAKKQALQIKSCLIQAKEYYEASLAVSLATRPTLLYYSAMNMALAEILLKQTGDSSLDKARAEHSHHGLMMRLGSFASGAKLNEAATALRAKPMIREDGSRSGTFELWHRSARELPIVGAWRSSVSNQSGRHVLMGAADTPLISLGKQGISLLECFERLPSMSNLLVSNGIKPRYVRASISYEQITESHSQLSVVVHPADSHIRELFYGCVNISGSSWELFDITEYYDGCKIVFRFTDDLAPDFHFPSGQCRSNDYVHFMCDDDVLNEFGLLYVGLFISGSFARYYPDKWSRDIDCSSPLSIAVEQLITDAQERLPVLTLSELSRVYFIPRY